MFSDDDDDDDLLPVLRPLRAGKCSQDDGDFERESSLIEERQKGTVAGDRVTRGN